ncbi:hypothetical protein BH11PLA2_BH11PLA2_34750 [soil metagenome]
MSAVKGRWVHVPGEPKAKEKVMGKSLLYPILLVIALLVTFIAGWQCCSVVSSLGHSAGHSNAIENAKSMLNLQQEAWNRGDINGFLSAYEMNDKITFYADDVISPGWVALSDRFTKSYVTEKKPMGQLTFSEVVYEPFPRDAVMVRGRWTLALGGPPRTGLFTILVKKTDTGWKIVHDHTSERKVRSER